MLEITGQEFRFNQNDAVAHTENLEQKLIVKEIKRRRVDVSTGKIITNSEGKSVFEKITKNKIDGILCYWFEKTDDGKKYKEEKFHSELLCPWNVAQKGEKEVEKWVNARKEFQVKNYR